MAGVEGLEPPAHGLEIRCSIHLSYTPARVSASRLLQEAGLLQNFVAAVFRGTGVSPVIVASISNRRPGGRRPPQVMARMAMPQETWHGHPAREGAMASTAMANTCGQVMCPHPVMAGTAMPRRARFQSCEPAANAHPIASSRLRRGRCSRPCYRVSKPSDWRPFASSSCLPHHLRS